MKYFQACNELPGSFETPHRPRSFHRPQHCKVEASGAVHRIDVDKTIGVGGVPLSYCPRDDFEVSRSQDERKGWANPGKSKGVELPAWIRKEKQVLCFDSYFTEAVIDQGVERQRVRKCKLIYYLEDDTMKVLEPHNKNSGIIQVTSGTLVRRHRIPFSYIGSFDESGMPIGSWSRTNPEKYITFWDLNVRRSIVIYGQKHRIFDCDTFTRNFLERLGISVPVAEEVPEDFFTKLRAEIESTRPLRPLKRVQSTRRLRDDEGRILRFFARWEDKRNGVSEIRDFCIHFFREDETLEVFELHHVNCGRYKAPVFLKRCKIPKNPGKLVTLPGTSSNHTVLNVVRSQGPGRIRDTVLIDNLETRPEFDKFDDYDNYFHEEDFEIGKIVNIGGRNFLIYDCDEFTRQFFREHFQREMKPINFPEEVIHKPQKVKPPYTGFGTDEDSLTSCNGLEPRPPQRDFEKFIKKDRFGFDSHILRFGARLIENDKVDMKKKFVINYFLTDDTLLVNELPQINSGKMATSARFLARTKVLKPRYLWKDPESETDREFYSSEDFYVGAEVVLNDHKFLLTEADTYALEFMEKPEEVKKYPHANIRLILNKLNDLSQSEDVKSMMAHFMQFDPDDQGLITEPDFRNVIKRFFGFKLTEHELITLVRHFRSTDERMPRLPRQVLQALLQTELKNAHFTAFAEVLKTLRMKDTSEYGFLSKSKVRNTLVPACAMSKSSLKNHTLRDLIDAFLEYFPDDRVDYVRVLSDIDWQGNSVIPVTPQIVGSRFFDLPIQNAYAPILYRDLIRELEKRKKIDTAEKIDQMEFAARD